jgi:ribosome-binding protein aMBF1 (putative translation factor)
MAVKNLKGKLVKIVSEKPSIWHEEAKWRAENNVWLKRSQAIALRILNRIDELNITQKELAKKMGVSPQLINRWVRGKENFTFETISKLEDALSVELLQVIGFNNENFVKNEKGSALGRKALSVATS